MASPTAVVWSTLMALAVTVSYQATEASEAVTPAVFTETTHFAYSSDLLTERVSWDSPAATHVSFEEPCLACSGPDPGVIGSQSSGLAVSGSCCDTCGGWSCVPGRTPCPPYTPTTRLGVFYQRLYESICCVDPCYEPKWLPVNDAAFFVESVRPVTQQRFRWNENLGMTLPDRSEYFWARADGKGRGPKPATGALGGTGLRFSELSLYTESATGAGSMFVDMPYRAVYPDGYAFGAGFADMNFGTKALLLDSEFLLVGFQFRTFMPTGRAKKGTGRGHIALEPSVLAALKFSPTTCLQMQVSQHVPLGGDSSYAGSLLHYHVSLNRIVGRLMGKDPVVATLEASGWSFQHGQYTDPATGLPVKSSGGTYVDLGCGLRVFMCDKLDFGVGASFGATQHHWASQLYRTELRWRF